MPRKTEAKSRGVFEKVPGVWYVRYSDETGRIRKEKAGSKNVAIKLYAKRKTEVLEGAIIPPKRKKVTFSDLVKDALEYSKTHKRTYNADVLRTKKLTDWIGDRAAQSITPQEIERWLSAQVRVRPRGKEKGLPLMPATLNRYRALLSLIYKLGMQNGKVTSNPARMVHQRCENNARERYLLPEEETRLRKVIEVRWPQRLPELDIALHTGMRRGEQYGAEWSCVDLEAGILIVPRSKHGEKRRVYLNDAAVTAFRVLWQFSKGKGKVFAHLYESSQTIGARRWFQIACDEAKITNFRWHDLRHTFGSRMVMAGVDIRTLQELMGHKTIGVTVRYTHIAPTHQLAAVQRLCDTGNVQKEPTVPKTVPSQNQSKFENRAN